jgi:hypothetical protein
MVSNYALDNPQDLLQAQIKLRGSLDERMVVWWIKATQYAVIDTILTPLFQLHNASFQKFQRVSDDAWGIRMLELAYYTALDSDVPLSEFTNPFTHKTGKVPPAVFGPNFVTLTTDGLQPPEHFPFGTLTFDGKLGPGYTDGQEVWVHENTLVKMTSHNPAFGNYIYNELVTYRGNWAELNDPSLQTAAAGVTYATTSNWRPWMMADDTPGHILSEGFGKKVTNVEKLPAHFLQMARQLDPNVINNPERILDTPPNAPPTSV